MRGLVPVLLAVVALSAPGAALPFATTPDAAPAANPPRLEHVAWASDVPQGTGIWLDEGYAYVAGYNTGFHVVDVRDPTEPKRVGHASGYSRDADLIEYDDGRRVAVTAAERFGIRFIDVTDPTSPSEITRLTTVRPHNVAVMPGTTYVFNANSDGIGTANAIIDASDLGNPRQVAQFGNHGCHDITFFDDGQKKRLVCAGVERTELWDVADPLAPELVGWVTNPAVHLAGTAGVGLLVSPGLHHFALLSEDGNTLLIGDEFAGGLANGCGVNKDDASTPLGAVWFYDVTGDHEAAPKLLSWISPNRYGEDPLRPHLANVGVDACTSHFGDLVPGKDQLVIGWYRAGVVLIDFEDRFQPRVADQWRANNVNAWDARVMDGHVFTGDLGRGMDVLKLVDA